jgi:hypothetical protein
MKEIKKPAPPWEAGKRHFSKFYVTAIEDSQYGVKPYEQK